MVGSAPVGGPNWNSIRTDSVGDTLVFGTGVSGTTEKTAMDLTSAQTVTGVKLYTGSGMMSVANVNLLGTVWHVGVGGANILSWQNPLAVTAIITRVIILNTHVSSGAATVAVGTTEESAITAADNFIDDYDLTTTATAPGVLHDSFTATDTEIKSFALSTGKWVTITASADPTGFTGNLYIFYMSV